MERFGVQEGMTVRSRDGEKLGKVVQCADDYFIIEKGFFFPKDYVARYDQVSRATGDEVHLNLDASGLGTGDEPGRASTSTASAGMGSTAGGGVASSLTTGYDRPDTDPGAGAAHGSAGTAYGSSDRTASGKDELRVPLAEEELTTEKHTRDAGEVRVRKDVVTEHRQVSVPVTREEVHVERVPASGAHAGEAKFKDETISMPLQEEEVEIRKRPVVREEVRVSKSKVQHERRADAEVRREEAHVEGTGNLERDRTRGIDEPKE